MDEHLDLETLAEDAKTGCREALGKIATLMTPVLLPKAQYLLEAYGLDERHGGAGDVVQTTLKKMVEKIHLYERIGGKSFRSWLFRIQENTIKDMGRRQRSQPKIVGDQEFATAISKMHLNEITSEVNEILDYVKKLGEIKYDMFVSSYLYEEKLLDISIRHKCSTSTVHLTIKKIVIKIRDHFGS